MGKQLAIIGEDGEQLTCISIPNGLTREQAIKEMIASVQPKEQKPKGKVSKVTYSNLQSVSSSAEGSRIELKYNNMMFYIDLASNKVLHAPLSLF